MKQVSKNRGGGSEVGMFRDLSEVKLRVVNVNVGGLSNLLFVHVSPWEYVPLFVLGSFFQGDGVIFHCGFVSRLRV
jgi:hypothetical protein